MRERSGIETEVETNVEGLRLEPHVESALFRIAQEAVSNAVRHSGTRRLRVSLEQRGDELVLTVRDWGKGLPEGGLVGGRAAGVGLESMRDRARLLGARFDIRSRAGEGTEVTVALPLRKAEPCQ
ncbi:Sensor protein VraS [bacterium HR24]|nr:Sensor protein VraS [bacterium HR24]